MILLGRRQRIAQAAPCGGPGEEPVDLAVSVPPSLEVIGETKRYGQYRAGRPHPLRAEDHGRKRRRNQRDVVIS